MGWGSLADILNKIIPGRKAALVDQLNALTVKYQEALAQGRDTDAAMIRKQMVVLRKKAGITEGDV